ncbi:MAG: ABC transporter permease, partial [Alphaproteobacteria bacterium]|nr:ABC transporter permease [Alphaproteobacteria bacterium]
MKPATRRRLARFRANRRGWISFWLFGAMFVLSLGAELLANNKPMLVWYDNHLYMPALRDYPETVFGGDLPTNTVFTDEEIRQSIGAKGWMIWPPLPYGYDTVVEGADRSSLLAPSLAHPLGTDDQARDVLARVIYGFRIS